jgi:hypothetical protein
MVVAEGSEGKPDSRVVRSRAFLYALLATALVLGAYPAHRAAWRGNAELHTLLETISSLQALTAGTLALVRFLCSPALRVGHAQICPRLR